MTTRELSPGLQARVLDQSDVRRLLPARDPYAHKGDFGRVLLLCGSMGYTGAAALAARAALRCGSGLVTVLVPQAVYLIVASKLDEAMVHPVACDGGGRVCQKARDAIHAHLAASDCGLIGPGLGRSGELTALLSYLVEKSDQPLVLDADGLNAFAGHIDVLRRAVCPVILTPHDGEFARLMPDVPLPREDLTARCMAAKRLAAESGCIVLLKGHRTVVTDGKTLYVNQTGNPGMATGGSGDVLGGMIVSLLGQGVEPLEAAALGAYLHGAAGDLCEQELGQCGMLPGDMIAACARLLK